MLYRWRAKTKLPNGSIEEVTVEASSSSNARAMLESQYGRNSVLGNVTRIW